MRRVFYPSLDGLRGIAALAVFVFHINENARGGADGWLSQEFQTLSFALVNGGSAVLLFFVLSGFVMGVNIDTSQRLTARLYVDFLIRRTFRLLPVLMFGVLLGVWCSAHYHGNPLSAERLWSYFTLQDIAVNGPLWSLRVEIAVSLVYPVMLFAFARLPSALALAFVMCWYFLGLPPGSVSPYITAFALGLLVPTSGRDLVMWLGRRWARIALPIAFAFFAMTPYVAKYNLMSGTQHLMAQSFGAFFIVAFTLYMPDLKPILESPFARYLGRISYSLYALHFPIVVVVMVTEVPHMATTYPGRLLIGLVLLAPVILLAHISHLVLEVPFQQAARQLTRRFVPA